MMADEIYHHVWPMNLRRVKIPRHYPIMANQTHLFL